MLDTKQGFPQKTGIPLAPEQINMMASPAQPAREFQWISPSLSFFSVCRRNRAREFTHSLIRQMLSAALHFNQLLRNFWLRNTNPFKSMCRKREVKLKLISGVGRWLLFNAELLKLLNQSVSKKHDTHCSVSSNTAWVYGGEICFRLRLQKFPLRTPTLSSEG